MQTAIYASPLGELLLAAEDGGLIGLWFRGQKYEGAGLKGLRAARREEDRQVLRQAEAWLDAYFARQALPAPPPLRPRGTAFQQRVWAALGQIPYGQTRSYGQLAAALGVRSARAVGGAAGRNPIALLIPCHRCLGAGGALTGYAGGLERKAWLLRHEVHTKP